MVVGAGVVSVHARYATSPLTTPALSLATRDYPWPRLNIFGKAENQLRPVWQASVPGPRDRRWRGRRTATRLAAAAVSGPITVFDAATGKPVHQLKGHGFGTAAIAWQPTGNLLASVGQDSKVRLWDAATGPGSRRRSTRARRGPRRWCGTRRGSGSRPRPGRRRRCGPRPANWCANCRRRPAR